MPLYEFYCEPCNTIFTFYAQRAGVKKIPACPKCSKTLERRMSMFSVSQNLRGPESLPMKPSRAEEGMRKLKQELDRLKDKDPREAERFKKKFERWAGVTVDYEVRPRWRTIEETTEEPALSQKEDEPIRDPALYEF
ncbi:MAG: hypothetical protein N3B18_13425 [Desulfobacterota bacterium]|nr:hypothetical protein [Thermodesulfobacteriota bacterium]